MDDVAGDLDHHPGPAPGAIAPIAEYLATPRVESNSKRIESCVPRLDSVLSATIPLIESGCALHWLHPRQKRPITREWASAPVHTAETFRAYHVTGANVGIRLGAPSRTEIGFLHLIDLDIRDASHAGEAMEHLRAMWPDFESFPSVISGSGGASRHFYFFTETPYRKRKLAKSDGWSMVFDPSKGRDVKKRDWEIDLLGTGSQAVLPPSIHPDTGNPYVWARPIDLDMLELGVGPTVATALVTSWGAAADDEPETVFGDDDLDGDGSDLEALLRTEPKDFTEEQIDRDLSDLPDHYVEDRDTWVEVGQALHHQYQGSQIGFEKWCEWSRQSEKFDAKNSLTIWKSFKQKGASVVTFATVAKAAKDARGRRLAAESAWLDEIEDEPARNLPIVAAEIASDLSGLLGDAEDDILRPKIDLSEDPSAWRQRLDRTEEGITKPTLPNIELIVANDARIKGCIGFNEFTQEIVLTRTPARIKLRIDSLKPVRQLTGGIWEIVDTRNGVLWSDSHDHALRLIIESQERQGGYAVKVSDRDLKGAIDMTGHANAFHPVRDYLVGLTWDGIPRIGTLWSDYLGAEDTPYHRDTARLTLVGAVTRVMEPGHKFDFVPILEGLQGVRKSTFISVLANGWAAELEGDLHDRKSLVEKMQGAWIMEIPELQGFSKAEVTTIKGFVLASEDKVRMAYARRATVFLRQVIFIGSTNDREYLRDQTGGRRFWPIACWGVTSIDTDRLRRERDQLWAEATHVYCEMRKASSAENLPLYLTDTISAAEAKQIQESRRSETSEEIMCGQIEHWAEVPIGAEVPGDDLDGGPQHVTYRNEICAAEIIAEMLGESRSKTDQRLTQLVGRALLMLPGWEKGGYLRTHRYGRQRVYRRIQPKGSAAGDDLADLLG